MVPDRESWRAVKRSVLYGGDPAHRTTLSRINAFCGRACLGGYYSFSVKVTGEVTPCPFIGDVVLGNAFGEDFWEIFARRESVPSFRKFISVPAGCAGCSYVAVCRGGCRAGNRDAEGGYTLRDHRCPGPWHEEFDAAEMLDRLPIFF